MAVNALYLDDWTVESFDTTKEGYRLVARYDVEIDRPWRLAEEGRQGAYTGWRWPPPRPVE